MSEQTSPDEQLAAAEQMEELRSLTDAAGEEVPAGMLASEVKQRIVELRAAQSSD